MNNILQTIQNISSNENVQKFVNNENVQKMVNNENVQTIFNDPIIKKIENEAYKLYERVILTTGNIPLILVNGINYKLNTLKSEIKATDQQYFGTAIPLSTIDLTSQLLPVRNQGNVCACVSFSTSCMKEYQDKTDSYLSPAFIYQSRSNYPNDCMTIKNALQILTLSGVCYDTSYTYDNIKITGIIPQNAIIEAKKFKIKSYLQINDVNSLKNALQNNGPCPIAFPVYNYSKELWVQNPGDKFIGGHCMTVVGYDNNSFIIRNSWGSNWGNKGYTNFPFNHWGAQWEVWTAINQPIETKETQAIQATQAIQGIQVTQATQATKATKAKETKAKETKSTSGLSKTTIIGMVSFFVCFLLIMAFMVLKLKKKPSINK